MLKVKFKNTILFVMILICIYLSSNVWLKLPEFFSPNTYEDNDLEETEADIWKILRPVKNVIKYNDNYTVLYSDKIGLWQEALNVLNDAFNAPSGSVTETAAFPAEYLKFDFNTNIPIEIFTIHMKVENDNVNEIVKNVKNVIFDLNNNNTIYIYNGENNIRIVSEQINSKELTDLVSSINFETKTKYSTQEKIGDETIQVPVPLEHTALNPVFVQSELDVFDIDRINEIAKNYFRNDYDYVRKSVEVSGNLVYVYRTEKILKINEDGLLDFYDASIEPEDSTDVYKSFAAAVNFTEKFLGFPQNGYLSNVENILLDGNEGYRFTFSYNILERPILFSRVRKNAALQIDVIGNNVISYKRFIRNIDDTQMDKMAEIEVLPAVDVIKDNIDTTSIDEGNAVETVPDEGGEAVAARLKPIKQEMIKEINNIYLGYFDLSRISREQVLRVVWVIETNEKTFIFNAISGALIEEW
ncbi:MAG: hypothetical protein GX289_10090 [Tissierellia bacterium]|jgi:regulatory protein YycH of two-component signal transduction system YycFG|nr:hypothetical protein [Tissierellia bacterium]